VLTVILLLGAAAGIWSALRTGPEHRDVPIIIYLVDTLRADRLGTYGYSRPTSPQIDALASDSVVFDQAYAPAPWTLPSVASLVTSTFVCEHGVVSNRNKLGPDLPTLAGQLSSVVYVTAGIYANAYVGPKFGLDRGYQKLSKAGRQKVAPGDVERLLDEIGNTPINPTGATPFFFYLHTTEPHNPYSAPLRITNWFGKVSNAQRANMQSIVAKLRGLTMIDWATKQVVGATDNSHIQDQTMADLERMQETISILYDSAVWWADANLKNVIDVLKNRGVWDKAIFVFLSDHGEEFGDHGGWLHDQSVYEELARVPLLIHFPGDEFAGRRIDKPVSLVDIMPTIFEYLGRPELCGRCRGSSLLPLLSGNRAKNESGAAILSMRANEMKHYRPWKNSRGDLNIVARRAQWKGIWNAELESLELYDLDQDPAEQANVSAAQEELADALGERARVWLNDCRARAGNSEEFVEMDKETAEELRALGYLN
jgi:arylsulfatase A-like enzyme